MALGVNTIFDVRSTGSDTANGGAFDPGQTAGMLMDGAATSATGSSPVFSSASYNFVAGDVGAWVHISSGTNWTPGWYQIASVASNQATLSAAIGAAYLSVNKNPIGFNTAAGCAITASPTAATWSIDYSQQSAAQFSYTDLASAGAGLTVSSAAFPFGKQQVGNALIVASGTNFTAGVYVIASVAAGVATVVGAGNITTGVGASGVGGLGGAFATPGKAASVKVAGNDIFWKANGTTPYNLSTNTANVAGGIVSDTTGGVDQTNVTWWVGWNTSRHANCPDSTWPIINANLQTSLTLLSFTGQYTRVRNVVVDGNSKTSLTGFNQNASYQKIDHIKAQNCTVIGIDVQGGNSVSGSFLQATACSGTSGIRLGNTLSTCVNMIETWANTTTGITMSNNCTVVNFLSYSNTGASSCGVAFNSVGSNLFNGSCYGNGSHGVDCSTSIGNILCRNVLCEGNGGAGFNGGAVRGLVQLLNCGGYNNTSGNYNSSQITDVQNFAAATGSFFTNAAAGDLSLNNTASQGALARAAGVPGVYPRGTTTGYQDIGAAQHQDTGGGAAGMLFIPCLAGV